ncbi:eukaryotic translation initiation factor 4B2-like isoform X1 [Salvia splendens]|uniref:eukaryotic translation initiation factor 4B2-like isoform X1 n=1 Tax=Salvia splendens TaxID=180675 RepID=UPI001C25B72C|nr:eukaryotic translation initiation factor 4B2-like isoform X1 [Salvia splendens]
MSKSPWGIGAWAAETEREEAEQREAEEKAAAGSFPSLKEGVSTAKQKKKTKMTLQEFRVMPSQGHGLTPEEMLRLPTGPKERSAEEMQHGRLGGGFSNYGSNSGRREFEGRKSYGFEDDGWRQQPRVSEFDQPSRADEVDNWGSMKKQTALPDHDSRESRVSGKYSPLGGASRADDVDNWASMKKPVSQPRNSSFGSRPETDRWARNESFGSRSEQNPSLSLSSPKIEGVEGVKVNKPNPFGAARPREEVLAEKGLDWKKMDSDVADKKQSVSGGSRPTSSQSSRPETPQSSRSEAPPSLGEAVMRQRPKVNPFGDAKPREVMLEEKGLDWRKIDLKLDRRVNRPEAEKEKNLKEEIEQLKKELLQKTSEEQAGVQDQIHKKEQELELLVSQLDDKVRYSQRNFERQSPGAVRGAGFNDRPPSRTGSYEGRSNFHDRPPSAPGQYEGYQERPPSRPGAYEDSRAGFAERPPFQPEAHEDPEAGFNERPHSRQGAYEENRSSYSQKASYTDRSYQEPRSIDGNERPRSRGSVNSWARPSDDRRYFQGSGGRVFSGSRDVDRVEVVNSQTRFS